MSKTKQTIELGDKVRDLVNGMTGIVMQIAECLNGCRRIQVDPDTLKLDGAPGDGWWMDEYRLKVLKKGVLPRTGTAPAAEKPGGPPTRVKY